VSDVRAWVLRCAAAEAVGMTAAAAAARGADHLLVAGGPAATAVAWTAVVAAGCIEALALGTAEATLLRRRLPALRAGRFVLVTVLVAGVAWAAGSAPGLLSAGTGSSAGPGLAFLLAAGAGVGVVTGGLLGAAQAAALPRGARRSAWVAANLVGWTVAMAVVMVGAGTPSAAWAPGAVLPWAALTGALAGALLGACLGWFAPSLTGPPVHNRAVLALLRRSPRPAGRALVGLRVTGRRSGRLVELPVMYAERAGVLWVAVGHTAAKTWWRNLADRPCVQVLRAGRWTGFTAQVVHRGGPGYAEGRAVYAGRWPRARLADDDVLVRLEPVPAAVPHT